MMIKVPVFLLICISALLLISCTNNEPNIDFSCNIDSDCEYGNIGPVDDCRYRCVNSNSYINECSKTPQPILDQLGRGEYSIEIHCICAQNICEKKETKKIINCHPELCFPFTQIEIDINSTINNTFQIQNIKDSNLSYTATFEVLQSQPDNKTDQLFISYFEPLVGNLKPSEKNEHSFSIKALANETFLVRLEILNSDGEIYDQGTFFVKAK
jgi:hypothetical protein